MRCSSKQTFSYVCIVKTKLYVTMTQDHLDSLLTIFIEYELTYNINIDDVINIFKCFTIKNRKIEL